MSTDDTRAAPRSLADFGDLGRTMPVSADWGFDRGTPVDRVYIERFLERHRRDIRGDVLEVGDDSYTKRFGGDRVARSDVLHVAKGAPGATIIADLADADHIPSNRFDCVILTQTLQYIYDTRAALRTLRRILAPGGVLLATFPGISRIDIEDAYRFQWLATKAGAQRMFDQSFGPGATEVRSDGNVLVAIAFLHGLAAEELRPLDLDVHDERYELVITARAISHET